jgi:hypothetical protein
MLRWFVFLATLLSLAACGMSSIEHDTPRTFPWPVPDVSAGNAHHDTLPDGRLVLDIEHLPLPGITPAMLAWWYQVLPISEVDIDGVRYPFYHLFHLSEHGRVWVAEPASDARPGMGVGALVKRQEWFGPYDSQGAGRITAFDERGMTVRPEVMGLWLGEITHRFEATPKGAIYRVHSEIGVTWPIIGSPVNALLRHSTFTDAMRREWARHQLEEVAMLRYFLPALYAQRGAHTGYRLSFKTPSSAP